MKIKPAYRVGETVCISEGKFAGVTGKIVMTTMIVDVEDDSLGAENVDIYIVELPNPIGAAYKPFKFKATADMIMRLQ